MKTRIAAALFLFTLTSAAFMNCSKGFQSASFGSETSSSSFNSADGPGASEFETADMSGAIPAYQDLQFRFRVPGFAAGATVTASDLPAWLMADSATGELAGVPPLAGTHSGIMVTVTQNGESRQSGPYTINVMGDAMKIYQWHLNNTGQTAFGATPAVAGQDMRMLDTTRSRVLGQNIRIAVSDSGVFQSHPGLAANLIPGASRNYTRNFNVTKSWVGDSTPSETENYYAHGTAVAGLIAERGWNGGARGVAPLARFAGFLFVQAVPQLIMNGLLSAGLYDQFSGDFDVFNYSWGDTQCALIEYEQAYKDKLKAGTSLRGGKGAVFLKAAGNEFIGGSINCYPTAPADAYVLGNANFSEDGVSPYLVMVGSVSAAGRVASYTTPGSNMWVSATGGEYGWKTSPNNLAFELQPAMVTTDFMGCGKGIKALSQGRNDFDSGTSNSGCTHTATMNGTSSASPVTAGAVALLLTVNPNLTWRDVKHILAVTTDVVDANAGNSTHPGGAAFNPANHVYQHGWVTNAAGIRFHNWYGFGRVNIDRAVAMARTYMSQLGVFRETNTGANYKYNSGNINLAVPTGSITGASSTLNVTENYRIEAVTVRVSVDNCAGALGVELTSPSGTKSILMNIHSQLLDTAITGHEFLSNAFYNELSNGTWTLKVINPRAGCNASFQNWQINVYGH